MKPLSDSLNVLGSGVWRFKQLQKNYISLQLPYPFLLFDPRYPTFIRLSNQQVNHRLIKTKNISWLHGIFTKTKNLKVKATIKKNGQSSNCSTVTELLSAIQAEPANAAVPALSTTGCRTGHGPGCTLQYLLTVPAAVLLSFLRQFTICPLMRISSQLLRCYYAITLARVPLSVLVFTCISWSCLTLGSIPKRTKPAHIKIQRALYYYRLHALHTTSAYSSVIGSIKRDIGIVNNQVMNVANNL